MFFRAKKNDESIVDSRAFGVSEIPRTPTLYPLPSTLYSLPSTLYPLLSTLYSLPSTLYSLEIGRAHV